MSKHRNTKRLTAGVLWMLLAAAATRTAYAAPADAPSANPPQEYTTPDITVEAKRPDWEESLSPGTVTVIRPEEFKGEQKSLPDFLQMVPGVHVREVNGKGQYTTVTVRGSTAAQVGVFIDGVLTNLGGDAAVDLSAIPIRNVERIEVYRGYIPARFGGTFIGGVVNIVTKKPQGTHGSAEVGPGSFGSKKASVEITAPVGSGSLLFGFNHESRDGDFPYRSYAAEQWMDNSVDGRGYQERMNIIREMEKATPSERANWPATHFGLTWEQDYADWWDEINTHYKHKADAANDSRRWRKYNDYKNTDAMLKWQNKNWMIKGTYKTINRHLPNSLWIYQNSYHDLIDPGLLVDLDRDLYRFDSRHQTINASELMVENRHSHGRLDWGWMLDYLHQNKDYRAEHINNDRFWEMVPMREWSRYNSDKYNMQIDGSYQISNRNLLDFQMNYSHERMKIDGDGLDKVIQDVATGYLNFYAQMRNQYDQEIFNAQLQDTITFDDRGSWQLTPSVRFNRSKIIGYSQFGRFDPRKTYHWIHPKDSQVDQKVTWQLALKRVFNDRFSMRMTGGTYFRLLNMYEIAGDGAGILPRPRNWVAKESVFPQPEYGNQFDLSAIWDGKFLGATNRTTITYFWRDTQRMLQLYRAGLTYSSFFNDVRGKVHGFELQTNFHWKKFDLDLEGTHLKIAVQRQDSSPGVHYPWYDVHPTYQPEWEGNLRLTYRPTERWLFFGEGHYMSKYYTHYMIDFSEPELSGRPTEPYMTFNMGLKWSPRKDMTLTLGCNDVFDRGPKLKVNSLQAFGSHPGAVNIEYPLQGRSYYMSFRYEF
ncbi:TonB-dependent receptor [Selenomonas sp. F0473]|uniref:TonB-dependent receptor n=1 Tax=Selenomonas sp. F0473 TaxID=999423 RepID=UPI00029DD71B|nr:TonB-dependent receptor plug domain-containing protein [Selenomonas sp. F0473]EKU70919.1 hypothetical protein HMPREF9161_01468 [Selenomonas sp. F0473]